MIYRDKLTLMVSTGEKSEFIETSELPRIGDSLVIDGQLCRVHTVLHVAYEGDVQAVLLAEAVRLQGANSPLFYSVGKLPSKPLPANAGAAFVELASLQTKAPRLH